MLGDFSLINFNLCNKKKKKNSIKLEKRTTIVLA